MSCISIEEFYKNEFPNLKENDLVLDVRSTDEYNEGHIPGSKNVPHGEVGNHVDELKGHDRIFIHCMRGGRASTAYQTLTSLAPDVNWICINDGGMLHWNENNYPVEK